MKTILLKFAGPLQSWGTDSNFENRYTDYYPSKSAVIGILSASLGYKRNEDKKIKELNNLDFAVRIDQKGRLIKDYQIAKKYKNGIEERTYVTNRYYLEDAIFVVALSGEDTIMDKIYYSVQNPYFQQFLGRRSIPPSADFVIGLRNGDILESIKNLEWQAADWYKQKYNNKYLEIYLDHKLSSSGILKYRRDYVESFSQVERKFNIRAERKINVDILLNDKKNIKEHDAFSALGGDNVSF